MAEDLRRKHIKTLEVLQSLSDENDSLKAENEQLKNVKWSELPDTPAAPPPSGDSGAKLREIIEELEAEARKKDELLAAASTDLKTAAKDGRELKKKYDGERVVVHQITKQIDIQAKLMRDLRDQLDAGRARDEGESEKLGEGEEKIGALESRLAVAVMERDGSRDDAVRGAARVAELEEELAEARRLREEDAAEAQLKAVKADEAEVRAATDKRSGEAAAVVARDELERKIMEGDAVMEDCRRLNKRVAEAEAERKRWEAEAGEWKAKLSAAEGDLAALRVKSAEGRRPELSPAAPREPAAPKEKDFDRFVKLKKENGLLRMQIESLQQGMGKRMR